MTASASSNVALKTLSTCDATLMKLDKMCCDPGRSPAMDALAQQLALIRVGVTELGSDVLEPTEPSAADAVLATIADTGAAVGKLQVTCCAPARMPHYARLLAQLTDVQLFVNAAIGQDH